MTREGAIGNLIHAIRWNDIPSKEALEMAIKALAQEPCDDAISRILKRMWNCRGKHTTSIDKVKMEQIIRDELPPVNPQTKTGHWIESRCDMYECSECDHVYTDLSGERYGMHYCPNCGCRMVEPQESEEVWRE